MVQFVRYAAYAVLVLQILVAGFVAANSYSPREAVLAFLLAIPAILALIALYGGPDREERKLRTLVAKARLRKELQDLGG